MSFPLKIKYINKYKYDQVNKLVSKLTTTHANILNELNKLTKLTRN